MRSERAPRSGEGVQVTRRAGRNAFAAVVLLCVCAVACAAKEGQPAPPLHATLANGDTFTLADNSGKVVVVNMWATWCAPCRAEMPALDAYYRAHHDHGLVLVALSMDDPKDRAKARELTREYAFPTGMAAEASMQGYGRIWRLPMTFVIDRQGVLRKDQWYAEDGLDAAALDNVITPLLAVPPSK